LVREEQVVTPDPSDPHSPWDLRTGWASTAERHRRLRFRDPDGTAHDLALRYTRAGLMLEAGALQWALAFKLNNGLDVFLDGAKTRARFAWSGDALALWTTEGHYRLTLVDPDATTDSIEASSGRITAPMPGVVTRLLAPLDTVLERNAPVLTLEAMKVVHTLKTPARGRITRFRCAVGESVPEGVDLADFEPDVA
jgi:3-methylcrotonyl-CoA carboxylase alpha subunit